MLNIGKHYSTMEQVLAKRDFLKNISSYSKLRAKREQKMRRLSKYISIYTTIERLELKLLHLVGTCCAASTSRSFSFIIPIPNDCCFLSHYGIRKVVTSSESDTIASSPVMQAPSRVSGWILTLNFNATKHNFVSILAALFAFNRRDVP